MKNKNADDHCYRSPCHILNFTHAKRVHATRQKYQNESIHMKLGWVGYSIMLVMNIYPKLVIPSIRVPTTPNPKNLSSCTKVEIFCRVACCARAWPQVRTKLTSDFRMINFLRFPSFIEFYGFLNFCRGACTRRVRDIKLISTFAISMIDNHSSQIWPKSAYFLILTRRVRASRANLKFFCGYQSVLCGGTFYQLEKFHKNHFLWVIIRKPRCIHNMSEV